MGIVDTVIAEPAGGSHIAHDEAGRLLGAAIDASLKEIADIPIEELLSLRYKRWRMLGYGSV